MCYYRILPQDIDLWSIEDSYIMVKVTEMIDIDGYVYSSGEDDQDPVLVPEDNSEVSLDNLKKKENVLNRWYKVSLNSGFTIIAVPNKKNVFENSYSFIYYIDGKTIEEVEEEQIILEEREAYLQELDEERESQA